MTGRSAEASPPPPRPSSPEDADGITIRPIATEAEFQECVQMQHETWGETYSGTVPTVILSLSQRLGGVVSGAFDADGKMLGFVFGMTGLIDGELGHWSDMLAVRPAARDRGIGRRLKLHQRDALRRLGVRTIHWTYDPLVARNAYLNLVKLGAVASEYVIDFYGADTGSTLHGALGTDRFIVRWQIDREADAPPAANGPSGEGPADDTYIVNPRGEGGAPVLRDLPDVPAARIEIPADIHVLIEDRPEIALAWRTTTREAFTWYLRRGYRVAGFSAVPTSGRCFYTVRASEN
jgi:predicted GNAT superfamily acetyltransferase